MDLLDHFEGDIFDDLRHAEKFVLEKGCRERLALVVVLRVISVLENDTFSHEGPELPPCYPVFRGVRVLVHVKVLQHLHRCDTQRDLAEDCCSNYLGQILIFIIESCSLDFDPAEGVRVFLKTLDKPHHVSK